MISYYQDTLAEYRGGCCIDGGRQTFKNSQRQIPVIAKRSCIQHLPSIMGELCLLSGGSSE
jgi:hypothetical protein